MKRAFHLAVQILLSGTCIGLMTDESSAAEIVWTNLAGGDWNTAANWKPNIVPSTNDLAFITNTMVLTVTVNTDIDCGGLALGGPSSRPTLNGTGALTLHGASTWANGFMSGTGRTVIAPEATLTVTNTNFVQLTSRTLENGGTILWTGSDDFALSNGVITNRPGALFQIQNAHNFVATGTPRIDNAGTFRKSGNSGTTSLNSDASFNNSGAVEVQSGMLVLGNGTSSGAFDVSAGATLSFINGSPTNIAGSSITGAGHLTLGGSGASLAGMVNVSGTNNFTGPNNTLVNLTGAYICTNNTLIINFCQVNFDGNSTVTPSVVLLNQGNLGGSNVVTVGSSMSWTGGGMSGNGRTVILPGVTLTVSNLNFVSLDTRTLDNGGTVDWIGSGNLTLIGGAVITNRPGALFQVQNAQPILTVGGGHIDNAGTFRKSSNSGATTLSSIVTFTNYGTVDIRNGILVANGGYGSSSNALLICALGGTNAGTGYGQVRAAGTARLNGGLSVDLLPGYAPASNDTFTVMMADARNGVFKSFAYPTNQVALDLNYTGNSVILRVTNVFSVARPVMATPLLAGSNVLLTWTATSNMTYRLENTSDAGSSNWTAVPGDVTATSNTAAKFDLLTTSNRFYRVRVLP